ncbi:hypothetical protein HPB48_018213 [Haemaphysalis longicornis]|uniref:Uncharacterized protein n=1 Tax=Haemaphysalis longicornis TaxID=44386 RepID=A0A9J6GYD7_HAELO|nr:hypothetical protein HPB48_018213 [Haemaphysalis longicornis]
MDKTAHQGRRKARIAYLEKKNFMETLTQSTPTKQCTKTTEMRAAVIDSDNNRIDCLTITNTNPEEVEAGAIALVSPTERDNRRACT